jgi:ATP-dependent RNA helicase RhlE
MPGEIGKLAGDLLKDPLKVSVAPQATTAERVGQNVIFVEASRKRALLCDLFADPKLARTIVFTRTKRGADRVAKFLEQAGVSAAAIHGDKSQGQRERALAAFKADKCRALVATDIAARGIDVDGVTHVIQYELPNVPEAYVHRIGRTARAGATGEAISLCADDERTLLRDIQKLTRQTIPSFDRRNDRALGAMVAVEAKLDGEKRPHRPEPKPAQAHGHGHAQPSDQQRKRRRRRPGNDQKHRGGPQPQGQRKSGSQKQRGWSPV